MAIDVAGTTKAAAMLMANTSLLESGVCVPMLTAKAAWQTQVIGVYDLIDPFLNVDYARRDEHLLWITTEFAKHQGTGAHLPPGTPNVPTPVTMIPKFMPITKLSRKVLPPSTPKPSSVAMAQDAGLAPEPGTQIPIQMQVRAGSPLIATGYGV